MLQQSSSSQDILTFICLICSKEKELVAVGECEHRSVCSYCTMKSRLHYDYKKCPICLKLLDIIFICELNDKTPYKTLVSKKDEFYQDEEFEKCGIYYTTIEGKEEALKLRGYNCPIKNCYSKSFENMDSLSKHLNKKHKKFYCQYCLEQNKLFISQMKIYNKSNLNTHIKYGEYDGNQLVCPPHPSCPFDNNTFYDEEQLFKHMNADHFICQICRDKKNYIFFSELQNLLAHHKSNHYCCPYEECLADIYVVYKKEEELISHLITKHKIQNASERLNKLIFDKKKEDENKELHHENGEFNFTEYIKDLKEQSEYHNKNEQYAFNNSNEQYYDEYEDYNHNYNHNNGYKNNKNYYHENKYHKNNYYGNNKYKKYINYSLLFSFYLNVIKEFITQKIKKENIVDTSVRLPKETIYQIIVMIDKFESNDELLELKYLNNFGISPDTHKQLKSVISSNTSENEESFKDIIKNLELKKLLIIYKYLYTCSKKVNNLFFRLEIEQIDEDLYEDFCTRVKKAKKIVLNKYERERKCRQEFFMEQLKNSNKTTHEDKKVNEDNHNSINEEKEEEQSIINKPKSNINISLNDEVDNNGINNINSGKKGKGKKKKGKGQFIEFNIRDYKKKNFSIK